MNVKDLGIFVVRVYYESHPKRALGFCALLQEIRDVICIILMVDNRPFLFAHFQWLGCGDFSVLKHFEVDQSILVDDSWRLELLSIEFGHVGVDLNSPFLESFVILEHRNHSADFVESFLGSVKFVFLD